MDKIQELKKLVYDIKEKEELIMNKNKALEDLKREAKMLETNTYIFVEKQVDSAEKKIFSNKEKRDLETKRLLSKSEDYITIQNSIEAIEYELKILTIEFSYNKRMFRVEEIISRLGV